MTLFCPRSILLMFMLFALIGCSSRANSNSSHGTLSMQGSNLGEGVQSQSETPDKRRVEELIWEGTINHFRLKWTTSDVFFKGPNESKKNTIKLSDFARRKSEQDIARYRSIIENKEGVVLRTVVIAKIKSILGSIVTFEISYVASGGTGANVNTQWVAVDFASSSVFEDLDKSLTKVLELGDDYVSMKFPVSINMYVSEPVLLASLLENSTIRRFVTDENGNTPKSLERLFIKGLAVGVDNYKDTVYLDEDSLSNFVFDRVENDKLIVKLQVYSQASKRYEVFPIEIGLPLEGKIKDYFRSSDTFLNKGGFDQFNNKFAEIVIESNLSE